MKQILIIDDNESIRSILSRFLKKFGYRVKTAKSGEEGIELFQRTADFDLVMTDIRMPGIDGNEVAKIIRNSKKSELPLVAITGFPGDVQKDMFNCSLIKPFKVKELQRIVQSFDNE